MQQWLKISVILCVFGFLKEIQPSEPFLTEYLLGNWNGRNITEEELNRDVYPFSIYSYMAQLIIVFLVTDFLRYKPLIVVCGMSGIVVWGMLLWTSSKSSLMILQWFHGTYTAADVAYYTYIYAKVDKAHYSKVSSYTRVAILLGELVGATASQILIYYEVMNYKELNFLTFGTQIAATFWSLFLPAVKTSVYFHKYEKVVDIEIKEAACAKPREIMNTNVQLTGMSLIWQHFKSAYTNPKVIQWSTWYALCFCGRYQILTYIQILYKAIDPNPEVTWNGGVDATHTFIGAIFALMAGYLNTGEMSSSAGFLLISTLSVLQGGAVLITVWFRSLYLTYFGYVMFASLCAFTMTVASAEVARHLEEESFALVFGFNTFVALILQSVISILIVDGAVISLDIVQQFMFYAFYFIAVGVTYLLFSILECIKNSKGKPVSEMNKVFER